MTAASCRIWFIRLKKILSKQQSRDTRAAAALVQADINPLWTLYHCKNFKMSWARRLLVFEEKQPDNNTAYLCFVSLRFALCLGQSESVFTVSSRDALIFTFTGSNRSCVPIGQSRLMISPLHVQTSRECFMSYQVSLNIPWLVWSGLSRTQTTLWTEQVKFLPESVYSTRDATRPNRSVHSDNTTPRQWASHEALKAVKTEINRPFKSCYISLVLTLWRSASVRSSQWRASDECFQFHASVTRALSNRYTVID